MTATVRPAIPVALAHRPVVGGLVAPWVNVGLADGGIDFRGTHHAKWVQAWTEAVCQTCGTRLGSPVVFIGGPNQLTSYFTEPPLHPECAAYAQRACPMVAGRMTHYADREELANGQRGKTCPEPGCDCGGWTPHPGGTPHYGQAAHDWFAVWTTGWDLAVDPAGELLGGIPTGVLRTCSISVRSTTSDPVAKPETPTAREATE